MYPNFGEHECMAFYESMPRKIDVVLKSRDYLTNYYGFCRQLKQDQIHVYSFSFGFATYFLTINVM